MKEYQLLLVKTKQAFPVLVRIILHPVVSLVSVLVILCHKLWPISLTMSLSIC